MSVYGWKSRAKLPTFRVSLCPAQLDLLEKEKQNEADEVISHPPTPSILGLPGAPVYLTKSFPLVFSAPTFNPPAEQVLWLLCERVITARGRAGSGKGRLRAHWLAFPSLWNSFLGALACLARESQVGVVL